MGDFFTFETYSRSTTRTNSLSTATTARLLHYCVAVCRWTPNFLFV